MASCSLIFKLKLLSHHYVCLLVLNLHDLCRETQKNLKTQFICQLSQIVVVFYSYADSVAVRSNHILLVA